MSDTFIVPYLNGVEATSIPYTRCMITNIVDHIGDELKADIYVAHLEEAVWAAYALKQKFNDGAIYLDQVEIPGLYMQDRCLLKPYKNFLEIYMEFTAKAMIKKVDKILTASKPLKDFINEKYSFKDIITIENYPYYHKLKNDKQTIIRALCRAEDSDILILYPNNIYSVLQFEKILDWLASLPAHFKMVSVGHISTKDLNDLNLYAEKIGMKNRVMFFNENDFSNMADFCSGADFSFICPNPQILNDYLTLSNRIFDCIRARLPILSYDVPAHKFYIDEYKIGEVVSLENQSNQMPELIKRFADKLEFYRSNLENAAKALVWEAQENKFLEFFNYPKTVTFIGKNDLSNNNRTLRMVQTLVNLGTKVNIVTTSDPKEPITKVNYYNMHTYFKQNLSN
ncbi:Uncharacterised protein [Legionella beliardensis]|uniref:Glycosyl transferases group 1 n=1 Tax=Legionella beliardensis TaxID=91822 RepID=A0A378I146_9GAMM|nr:glycosyltransferase family 1 protein [Legionella beliardensis]STX28908.1 Uncharacterised protein [Legionella beliardensis]